MARPYRVSASASFEVEVAYEANYHPPLPARGPSYASGGEPPEPAELVDIEAVGLAGLRRRTTWEPVDLLAGVDHRSPPIRKLMDNIAAFHGEDAEAALLEAAADD